MKISPAQRKILSWALRLIAALILLQTLYFKFTGAPESVYIFETMGMEPWGRYATGIVELITSVLLLIPGTIRWGAALGVILMSGAIFSHLFRLGVNVQGDGGLLFFLALITFASCAIVFLLERK